jgi:hypothetical protein
MRFSFIKRADGSVTPLILGLTIIIASVIATLSDITYLGNAHLALKSEGESLLAEAMRNLSAQDYYEGSSATGSSATGSSATGSSATDVPVTNSQAIDKSVPIDCQNTYVNILNSVKSTPFYLSNEPIVINSYKCKNSWVKFEISAKVLLPFLPSFLADVNPTITSSVRGGSRYFSD